MRANERQLRKMLRNPASFFRGCTGKQRYPSKRVALSVKRVMIHEAEQYGVPAKYEGMTLDEYVRYTEALDSYKCSCGHWHLGHSSRKEMVIR